MPDTILIAVNERSILDSIENALKVKGISIHTAENVKDAATILLSEKIDLLIVDMNLPEQGGKYLIEFTRKKADFPNLPIILITAVPDSENVFKAKELGINGILSKPINVEEMLKTVTGLLEKKSADAKGPDFIPVFDISLLIVDDEKQILNSLTELFNPIFNKIHTAKNYDDAIEICQKQTIDILISDVLLPGKSGFDFIEWINRNSETAGIPVVLITGVLKDAESIKKAKQMLVDKYVIKPLESEMIKSTVMGLSSTKYRREKMRLFINICSESGGSVMHVDQDALVRNIRDKLNEIKKQQDIILKQLLTITNDSKEELKKELEGKSNLLEQKSKELNEQINEIKKSSFASHQKMVEFRRTLQNRMEQIR